MANNQIPAADTEPAVADPKLTGPTEPVRKFLVVHGAVSGNGRNKKGETVEQDYYAGSIVTAEQLDNNVGHYLIMGAIVAQDE